MMKLIFFAAITVVAVSCAQTALAHEKCRSVEAGKCPGPDVCMMSYDECGNKTGHGACRWVRDSCGSGCKKTTNYSCSWTLFKQCGESWSNERMGSNGDTICQVGCLMSSISMALNTNGIRVDGHHANPGTVNNFLHAHGGYVPGSSALYDAVIDKIDPRHVRFTGIHRGHAFSLKQIDEMLEQKPPKVVIANVLSGQHFVLVTGVDHKKNQLYVNDPGFPRWSYTYDDAVVGFNTFDMSPAH